MNYDLPASESAFDVFTSARPVWADAPQRINRYVWLRPAYAIISADEITLRIVSTVPYRIFVSGHLHSWGPWRGTNKLLFVTEHKIMPSDGKVELAILAHHTARPSAEMDMTNPWLMVEATNAVGEVLIASDSSWRVADATQWQGDTLASWFLRDMAEVFTADKACCQPLPVSLDKTFPACVLPAIVAKGKKARHESGCPPMNDAISPTSHRILPLDELPRVPQQRLHDYARKVWERWQSSLGVWYADYLKTIESVAPDCRPLNLCEMDFTTGQRWQSGAVCKFEKSNKPQAVLFDFQRQVSGFLKVRAKCNKPCLVEFAYSYHGIDKTPVEEIGNDVCDFGSISCQAGETIWTGFRSYGLRSIAFSTENINALDELEFEVISTAESFEAVIDNDCNAGELLNQGMEVSRRTLEICSSDSLFDCPTRERAQWLGDSMLSAQVIADAFGNIGPMRRLVHSIVSCALPGKFLKAVIPSDFLDEIPVSEPLLIEGICWYAQRYEPQANWLVPFLKQRVETFAQFMTPDGLLDELPGRLFMDWTREIAQPPLLAETEFDVSNRKISPVCPYDFRAPRTLGMNATINANWLRGLNAIKNACDKYADDEYATVIAELEAGARASYLERFVDSENALIIEQMPPADSYKFSPSELPCYAALAAGILNNDTAEAVIKTCIDPDKLMIRIGSSAGSRYVVEGLLRYGYLDLARRYVSIAFGDMIRADGMLWEHFFGGNPSHAWGAYSVYMAWKGQNF